MLGRLRPKRIVDPTFGTLVYRGGVWHGRLESPDVVRVFADQVGPDRRQHELFTEMKRRFDRLAAIVEVPLADEYRRCRDAEKAAYEAGSAEAFAADFPTQHEARDIWRIARLCCVEVQGDDTIDFCLIYAVNWGDPEHSLSVLLRDWKVIDVGKEG
jgi:hypothetical protein